MRFAPLLVIALAFSASAQEPEKLAPPKAVEEVLPDWLVILPPEPRPEHGRRSVWQVYSVDATGRFRSRVIYGPCGAYYLHNLSPYPWPNVNARYTRPFVSP